MTHDIPVYLEIGGKRTFAGAIDWPGWCRSGHDEASALDALIDFGTRYAHVLRTHQSGFQAPKDSSVLSAVERLSGNSTTDFGAPAVAPADDLHPISDEELPRLQSILEACWLAFDEAAEASHGRELRVGPRGGGRDLQRITKHVLEADAAYLGRLGMKFKVDGEEDSFDEIYRIRETIVESLKETASMDKPARGLRGGVRWMPRYFIRRVAWHVLDHAWEIEERII